MHVYIYASELSSQKYTQLLAKIETKITDIGLNGKIIRLNPMHNLEKTISDEAKPDRTLVLVGHDDLFNNAISILANTKIVVGYIPIKENSMISQVLGIESALQACDVLVARRIKTVDLGIANKNYFLTELVINSNHICLEADNEITIENTSAANMRIINLPSSQTNSTTPVDAHDGLLNVELVAKGRSSLFGKQDTSKTQLTIRNGELNSDDVAIADGTLEISSPIKIGVSKEAIILITGKGRSF